MNELGKLELKPGTSEELRRLHARLKGVHEFLEDVVDAAGGADRMAEVVRALGETVPWAAMAVDAAVEALPPVKFLLKLFEGLVKLEDPNALGQLACTLAFQRAVQQAVPEVLGLQPPRQRQVYRALLPRASTNHDFTEFSWERALSHPFVTDATLALENFGAALGFDGPWNVRLQRDVHARFVLNLKGILSHGETRERFAPFRERLELADDGAALRSAVLAHADTQRWLFEERPVLGNEPFSLAEVYVEPRCTLLDWEQIRRDRDRRNPFDPALERRPLAETVIALLGERTYRDAVIVQGPAGSGKSSFTLALAASLIRAGMTPLRVELKHLDARSDVPLADALARALECNDLGRFPERSRFLPQGSEYGSELRRLFEEEVAYQGLSVCPYVLILDGWDELPLSGNHNYLERLRGLLRDVDEIFLQRREPKFPVRVVLAGRPSDFLAQTGVLRPTTRIVTLQPWTPIELTRFVEAVSRAQARRAALDAELGISLSRPWRLPARATLDPLLQRFDRGALDVLGSPLIAHLVLRLLGERAASGSAEQGETAPGVVDALLTDATTLYRHLVDLVIEKAGKAPSAEYRPERGAMISGGALRQLLHRTAEVMTVLGIENVAHDELVLRLDLEEDDLDQRLRELEGPELVSRLMISFFFKGGHQALGCEFSHKSFREYLFAECLVEALKDYGRRLGGRRLPKRSAEDYWKEFERDDPRYALSRRLAELLGPQWLTQEVTDHVAMLIDWEVRRSEQRPAELPDDPAPPACSRREWECIRDGLADLWDWWGEGVHLRPQPERRRQSREYEWHAPLAFEIACGARFRAASDIRPPPIRLVTVDAHLGDALCTLNALVHAALLAPTPVKTIGRYQRLSAAGVRFAPSAVDRTYFALYQHRINAAGYRPSGPFPRGAQLGRVDLVGVDLGRMNFAGANLARADLSGAALDHAHLRGTNLGRAVLTRAVLSRANLEDAYLEGAYLPQTNLRGASLSFANLKAADLVEADLSHASLTNADLTDADLRRTNLHGADLSKAVLHDTYLANANTTGAQFTPEQFPHLHAQAAVRS